MASYNNKKQEENIDESFPPWLISWIAFREKILTDLKGEEKMRKIGSFGQKWLKGFHVFFSCTWAASGLCLTLMNLLLKPTEGMELYGIDISRKFIDDVLVAPAAVGCLLTAVIYSSFTNWGWFKHNWITVKWIITIFGIIFGTFWLAPWLNTLSPISATEGLSALSNPEYIYAQTMNLWGGAFQNITVILAIFISVLKPWTKRA